MSAALRCLLVCLLCALCATHVHAQPPYVVEWEKTFGTVGYDEAWCLLPIENNGVLVIGQGRNKRIYAVWLDSDGNIVRERFYSASGGFNEYCLSAVEAHEGDGFILVGQSDGTVGGDQSNPSKGLLDVWILKIDKQGNKIWDRRYGGSGNDLGRGIIQTPDGYMLTANTSSPADGDVSEPSRDDLSGLQYDLWVLLLDKDGHLVREKRYGGNGFDYVNISIISIIEINKYQINLTTDSSLSGDITTSTFGGTDYLVLTIDNELNLITQHRYGGAGNELANKTLPQNGVTYISGSSWSGISGNKITTAGAPISEDIWIIQLDASNNKIGEKNIRANKENELRVSDGWNNGYMFFGLSSSDAGYDKTEGCRGDYDYWLVLTDAQMNPIWDKTLGGQGRDWAQAAVMLPDNSIVIAGRSYSPPSGDKQAPLIGDEDYWVIKLRPENPMAIGLPIQAAQAGRKVRVKWTLPPYAAGTCIIERELGEMPRGHFTQIGELAVNRGDNYEYIDSLPEPGRSWYRVRWAGENGTLYSQPAEVFFTPEIKPWLEVTSSEGRLTIRQTGGDRVQVYSMQGALVMDVPLMSETVTVDAPAKGVYIVVLMANGQAVARQKVLILE